MVPEGWQIKPLSKLLEKVIDYRGKAPPKTENGVRLITARNVRPGFLSLEHEEYIDADAYDVWMNRGLPRDGDILFTTEAPLGNVAMFPREGKYALGQRLLTLRADASNSSGYLFQYLLSHLGQTRIRAKSSGSTALGIKSREFVRIDIPVPPLEEQKKIAEILSTWDKAIETTEKLLANAETQKRALMQQLLTGKKRLKGFAENRWIEAPLSLFATIIMGSSPPSSAYNDECDGLPLIQGNADIADGYSAPRAYTRVVTQECRPGDSLLSVRAPVGTVAKSVHGACIGRGIAVLRAKDPGDQVWLHQFLIWFEPRWSSLSQGSTFEAVNGREIKKLAVAAPESKAERAAIGNILACQHETITHHKATIARLQTEKRALMQQLLTGKRRVTV